VLSATVPHSLPPNSDYRGHLTLILAMLYQLGFVRFSFDHSDAASTAISCPDPELPACPVSLTSASAAAADSSAASLLITVQRAAAENSTTVFAFPMEHKTDGTEGSTVDNAEFSNLNVFFSTLVAADDVPQRLVSQAMTAMQRRRFSSALPEGLGYLTLVAVRNVAQDSKLRAHVLEPFAALHLTTAEQDDEFWLPLFHVPRGKTSPAAIEHLLALVQRAVAAEGAKTSLMDASDVGHGLVVRLRQHRVVRWSLQYVDPRQLAAALQDLLPQGQAEAAKDISGVDVRDGLCRAVGGKASVLVQGGQWRGGMREEKAYWSRGCACVWLYISPFICICI
jgi:hypothetical protein